MAASRGSANRPPRISPSVMKYTPGPTGESARFTTGAQELLGGRFALPRDVADHVPSVGKRILHITFEATVVGGVLGEMQSFDEVEIKSVRFVPITDLCDFGFSERFRRLIQAGFPGTGERVYVGPKSELGL